jgi:hypothetical protein
MGAAVAQSVQRRAVRPEFNSRRGQVWEFSSPPALGPNQLPTQSVAGASSSEIKRPGHEADHWPPSSAEVMNAWSYTTTPPYVFTA